MEQRRACGAADRSRSLWRQARSASGSTASTPSRPARAPTAAPCISRAPACIASEPACVTVCPTGASYKRAEDGIVLVDEDLCIGCKLCSWACPYGAREFDDDVGVMKKCTLCIDRIYNETFDAADRVPACVATCPVSARHFGDLGDPGVRRLRAGGRARRLRADAGDGLQAGQPVSAAAPAPRCGAAAEHRPPAPARRRRPGRPSLPALGRPGLVALIRCIPPSPSSSSPPRRAPATACCSCSGC